MTQLPPAKRTKLAVPVRVGGDEAASPRSRRLRQILLVVLFMVRVTVRTTSPSNISQISGMIQRNLEQTFHKYQETISSKLETFQGHVDSKLETFSEQFDCLRHEMRQLANKIGSNRHVDQHNREGSTPEHVTANRTNSNIQLCFLNYLKPPVYTDKDITDVNNKTIKVALFEGDKKITTGPFSKAQIEILVLHGGFYNKYRGSWTEEEFDKHIVQGRDEQAQVLGTVRLTNGEAELNQIQFREGSCRKKIVLAARVCKTENTPGGVLEAIMKPVEVKDRRNEPNEKRHPPRLDDEVYRLEEIARNGAYHKRLEDAHISTVEGFLKVLNKDPNRLRKILGMETKHSSWSKLIRHARTCVLGDRQELKRSEHGDVVLYFNCVHDLVGAAFSCDYSASEEFTTDQKTSVNMWKEHAYKNLEDIPSNYVMKGGVPARISSATDVAAGPSSVPPVGLSQLTFSDEFFAPYQDFENAEFGPMITDPVLSTHDYQGQGTTQLGLQQITLPSVGPQGQYPQGLMHSPNPFEALDIQFIQHTLGASTSAPPNLEPPAEAAQMMAGAGAEPSRSDQIDIEQGQQYATSLDDGKKFYASCNQRVCSPSQFLSSGSFSVS